MSLSAYHPQSDSGPPSHQPSTTRNFIIKHTRPSARPASIELASQQQSTRRSPVCFIHYPHRATDGYHAQQFFFSVLATTRSRIIFISSPHATNNTTHPASFRSLIPIRLLPHTPRVSSCGNFRSCAQCHSFDVRRVPLVFAHSPRPRALFLSPFLLFLLLVRGYTQTPVSTLYATPLCPFNFFYSLAPSPPPLLQVCLWEKMRTIDVATAFQHSCAPAQIRARLEYKLYEAQSGVVQLAPVLPNTV